MRSVLRGAGVAAARRDEAWGDYACGRVATCPDRRHGGLTMEISSPQAVATPKGSFDPLRFCVYTTVALLAWLLSPPVMVMVMSGVGLWAYSSAMRGGLTRSKCLLRSPKLVLVYLGSVFAAGAIGLGLEIAR